MFRFRLAIVLMLALVPSFLYCEEASLSDFVKNNQITANYSFWGGWGFEYRGTRFGLAVPAAVREELRSFSDSAPLYKESQAYRLVGDILFWGGFLAFLGTSVPLTLESRYGAAVTNMERRNIARSLEAMPPWWALLLGGSGGMVVGAVVGSIGVFKLSLSVTAYNADRLRLFDSASTP